jgi:Ring finger domain
VTINEESPRIKYPSAESSLASFTSNSVIRENFIIVQKPANHNSRVYFAKPGEIRINESNFDELVPVIKLNSDVIYNGNFVCGLCKGQFYPEVEIRLLKCRDLFHGQCIRDYMIKDSNRICPVCNQNYS